jgi:hypothetical protein
VVNPFVAREHSNCQGKKACARGTYNANVAERNRGAVARQLMFCCTDWSVAMQTQAPRWDGCRPNADQRVDVNRQVLRRPMQYAVRVLWRVWTRGQAMKGNGAKMQPRESG